LKSKSTLLKNGIGINCKKNKHLPIVTHSFPFSPLRIEWCT
jgi:hypothetical protein